ncbi:MAG: hypothetical protein OEW21_11050, partial [Betaproteobacteria bacterium]|nr:hypothetical protein [Betaproteobacteria bacterium]
MTTRYSQAQERVSEYSQLSAWSTARRADRWRVLYGAAVAVLVLVSYALGALHWLPRDPEAMDLQAMLLGPIEQGYLLGT